MKKQRSGITTIAAQSSSVAIDSIHFKPQFSVLFFAMFLALGLLGHSSKAYAGERHEGAHKAHKHSHQHRNREGRNIIRDRKIVNSRPAERPVRTTKKDHRNSDKRHIKRNGQRLSNAHDRRLDHYRHHPRYTETHRKAPRHANDRKIIDHRRSVVRDPHYRAKKRHVAKHRPYYRKHSYLSHRSHGHARIDRFHYHGHHGHRHWGYHSHRHPGAYFGASIVLGDFYASYEYDDYARHYPEHRRVRTIARGRDTYYSNLDGSCYVEDVHKQRKVMMEVDPEYCRID